MTQKVKILQNSFPWEKADVSISRFSFLCMYLCVLLMLIFS